MESLIIFGIIVVVIIVIAIISAICIKMYHSITFFPNLKLILDITNKRKMENDDLFDYYVFENGTEHLENHIKIIEYWKSKKIKSLDGDSRKIDKFLLRYSQNEYRAFTFIGQRTQTRYMQKNYVRSSYKTTINSNHFNLSPQKVSERIEFLKTHDYNVSYSQFNKSDQRTALTKKLRQTIKERDNYTCQTCGKHMPDEVGLHIDHIVPIRSGGKSVPTNLQVLCSKCNAKKG